jgi:hypothetical protein
MTYPVTARGARDPLFPTLAASESCDPITLADHLEASIDLLEIEDSTTLMVPAVDGLNSEEAKVITRGAVPTRTPLGVCVGTPRGNVRRVVVVRRAASESGLGVRTEHVRRHLELAVLLPLEHDKIFAGSGSRAS